MKTVYEFFKEYKDRLPYSYQTFRRKFLLNDDVVKNLENEGVIYVMGGEKRKIIKILDEDKFINKFFAKFLNKR